jgi:hypothetical protein
VGLIEVQGRAGAGAPNRIDVVVLVDRSKSTFALAGVDVDGDGIVGEATERVAPDGRRGSAKVGETHDDGGGILVNATDPADTIVRAELVAAQGLLERLDPMTTRMGLVAFAGSAKIKMPLEMPSEDLRRRLDKFELLPQSGGTNFHAAILRGLEVLRGAPTLEEQTRHCVMLLLSDGVPNEPAPLLKAEAEAIAAARLAAKANTRIYSIALGSESRINLGVFQHLARISEGQVLHFVKPGDVMTYLPHINLTRLESVSIENVTTGESARAMRMFPDGSFDAYAPLAPGENVIRVTARALGGASMVVERRVIYQNRDPRTPREVQLLQEFLDDVRARTVEVGIVSRLKANQGRLRRDLRIEQEE